MSTTLLSSILMHLRAPEGGTTPSPPRVGRSPEPPESPSDVASPRFMALRDSLRSGGLVEDRVFDLVYPPPIRRLSAMHWTPVEAAVSAAKLLAWRPDARLLDIGSGVGKFCIVAAASVRARVMGIEQRGRLVDIARSAARRCGVDVAFVEGTFEDCDPDAVDGIYLFNPFAENLCSADDRIDRSVELSESRFVQEVAAVRRFLRAARPGTRVVTYCGFGGQMPEGYALHERRERALELWVKRSPLGARAP